MRLRGVPGQVELGSELKRPAHTSLTAAAPRGGWSTAMRAMTIDYKAPLPPLTAKAADEPQKGRCSVISVAQFGFFRALHTGCRLALCMQRRLTSLHRTKAASQIASLSVRNRLRVAPKATMAQVEKFAATKQTVLVLDYGSQYTQLIARRIREIGLFSVLFPGDASMVRMQASRFACGGLHKHTMRCVHVVHRTASRASLPASSFCPAALTPSMWRAPRACLRASSTGRSRVA